jgi:hypothetical protein
MLGLLVPHYARVVCGGIEMCHKGKVVSVEAGPCVRAPSCLVTDDALPDLDGLELQTLPDSSRSYPPREVL